MKLIIDIPEEMYKDIQSRDWKNGGRWFSDEWKAIHNGTPISDNATNGDVIKAMFPNGIKIDKSTAYAKRVTEDWLNSSYQR